MLFNLLLLSGLSLLGSYAAAQDCSVLREIFTEYNIDIYWEEGTNDCCNAYKDFEYPVIVNCNNDDQIIKIHITNLYLENKTISNNFCKFSSLISLELMNNGFVGEIPSCITSLTSLEYLNLSDNSLTGSIPHKIEYLSNLKELTLSNNKLTGEFPESLGNIGSLTDLYIDSNQLSGELPHSLDNLVSIKSFDVSDNQFSGELPEEFYNMYTLEHGYFNNNGFSGKLDRDIGVFSVLTELDFTNNNLEGKIPSSIGFLQNLEWLSLSGNKFTGDFPANIAKSKYLVYLDISNNDFTSVPTTIKRLENLGHINITKNPNLKGELHLADEVEICLIDNNNVCIEGGACQSGVKYCSNLGNNNFELEAKVEEEQAGFENVTLDDAAELEGTQGNDNPSAAVAAAVSDASNANASDSSPAVASASSSSSSFLNNINNKNMNTNPTLINSNTLLTSTTAPKGDDEFDTSGCWVSIYGYPCCEGNDLKRVYAEDNDGKWGYNFTKKAWCGISSYEEISNKFAAQSKNSATGEECWSLELGYSCCIGCTVYSVTSQGSWGVEHNHWCGIPSYCSV